MNTEVKKAVAELREVVDGLHQFGECIHNPVDDRSEAVITLLEQVQLENDQSRKQLCALGLRDGHYDTLPKAVDGIAAVVRNLRRPAHLEPDVQEAVIEKLGLVSGEALEQAQRERDAALALLPDAYAKNPNIGNCMFCGSTIWKLNEHAEDSRGMFHPICAVRRDRDEARAALVEMISSHQICVGAAGIGDFSELCGWIDDKKAALAKAEACCESFLLTLDTLIANILEDERKNLHHLPAIKRYFPFPIFRECGERKNVHQESVQAMPPQKMVGAASTTGSETEAGASASGAKGEKPTKVSELQSKVPSEPPGESRLGLSKSGPLQVPVQNNAEERSCIGKNKEAEQLPGVRLDWTNSRASRRLQQAVESGVALQNLSWEEAQEILNLFSSDCGTALLAELERLRGCDEAMAEERNA